MSRVEYLGSPGGGYGSDSPGMKVVLRGASLSSRSGHSGSAVSGKKRELLLHHRKVGCRVALGLKIVQMVVDLVGCIVSGSLGLGPSQEFGRNVFSCRSTFGLCRLGCYKPLHECGNKEGEVQPMRGNHVLRWWFVQ